jgi:cytochrome c(L)
MIGKVLYRFLAVAMALALFGSVAHGGAGDIDSAEQSSGDVAANADKNPYTGDETAIKEGRKLWRKTGCYSCHGGVAEGGVGPSLIDDEWIYKPTDKTLFKTIAEGRRGTVMAGWSKELDPDQIWKVVAYIRSLYQGDPDKIIW